MDAKKEQVERKLIELESVVANETTPEIVANKPKPDVSVVSRDEIKSDLCFFGGLASLALGLLLLFQHVKVGTGMLAGLGFGGQGFGLLLIPMLIGIGWIMYDAKSRIAWMLLSLTCVVIFFTILSGLIMTFPTTSLLGLIIMLLPFALGGMLLLKGLGGPDGVKEKLKKEGLIK